MSEQTEREEIASVLNRMIVCGSTLLEITDYILERCVNRDSIPTLQAYNLSLDTVDRLQDEGDSLQAENTRLRQQFDLEHEAYNDLFQQLSSREFDLSCLQAVYHGTVQENIRLRQALEAKHD